MMRRRLFAVVSAVSLLLCLGTVGLWVRSESSSTWVVSGRGWMYADMAGGFLFRAGTDPIYKYFPLPYNSPPSTLLWVAGKQLSREHAWQVPGVDLFWGESAPGLPPVRVIVLQMGYWPLVLLWAILPLCASVRRIRLLNRQHGGRCQVCAYDLTGNTSGVCPECGTPVPKAPADKNPRPA